MSAARNRPLVAVDIGNSRVKMGLFRTAAGNPLPEPAATLDLGIAVDELDRIAAWLAPLGIAEPAWSIGSVQREIAGRLVAFLRHHAADSIVMLSADDLPLQVAVPQPDRVGIDRLLDAVAANRLRPAGEPAIVVDLGSAITVDLLTADGAFAGGAILPGIGTSARAMHEFTDLLPQVDARSFDPPPPALGTATIAAMQSGLYYGAVGAVRELIAQLSAGLPSRPRVFLTGGAAPAVARALPSDAVCVPHLTLAGIALANVA